MKKIAVLSLIFFSLHLQAQQSLSSPASDQAPGGKVVMAETGSEQPAVDKKLAFILEYQDLYSTHNDHFRGGSLTVAQQLTPVFRLGIGAEYSGNNYHLDNDWNLTHLRFLPVFLDQQFRLPHSGRLFPVLHVAEGLTYLSYNKEIIALPGKIEQRREAGVYFYAGTGLHWKASNRITLLAEGGFKGCRMSFNEYDVNPHGLMFRLGVQF